MKNPLHNLNPTARLVWLVMIVVYLGVQWGRRTAEVGGPVDWYLTDLVCLPLVLGLVLMIQRHLGQSQTWVLPLWHGVFAVAVYAIYFELVLPRLSSGAVADPGDVLAYLCGWLLFELLINRPQKECGDPETAGFFTA